MPIALIIALSLLAAAIAGTATYIALSVIDRRLRDKPAALVPVVEASATRTDLLHVAARSAARDLEPTLDLRLAWQLARRSRPRMR